MCVGRRQTCSFAATRAASTSSQVQYSGCPLAAATRYARVVKAPMLASMLPLYRDTGAASAAGASQPSTSWLRNADPLSTLSTRGGSAAPHTSRSASHVTAAVARRVGSASRYAPLASDGKADIALFRPSNTTWYILTSSSNFQSAIVKHYGLSTDILVPGDYDEDGRTDVAVFRPSTNTWYAWLSATNTTQTWAFGASGDIPVPGDYDGDGITDLAVFRPSNGTWYIWKSRIALGMVQPWGLGTDVPINKRP